LGNICYENAKLIINFKLAAPVVYLTKENIFGL